MNTAAKVAAHKAANPHLYCANARCLWRIVERDGSANSCKKHPLAPVPPPVVTPASPCNVCDAPSASRVEVRTDAQRWVVCARCAVTMAIDSAERGSACRIVAFIVAPESVFVASDGWYSPNVADVATHQRELDARAEQFAVRIQAVIARRLASVEIAA